MALAIKPSTEETYRRHVAAVHRFCLWRTNSGHDAEDAAVEVFVKLAAGKAENVEPERLLGWLLKARTTNAKTWPAAGDAGPRSPLNTRPT